MKKEEIKERLLETNYFETNEWLDKYCELIELNENTSSNKLTTQSHHILPNFYFKIIGEKKDNSTINKVNLLYKDHILAHYYLSKCIINKYYHNAFSAVLFLIRDNNQFKKFDINELDNYQKDYEKYKESYFQNEEISKKKSLKLKGLKRTKETKQLISKNSKGKRKNYSEESKLLHSQSLKGNKNRLGSKHTLESREKISKSNKNKPKPEVSKKLKGKHKSQTHILNMSKAHKGKKFSKETKKAMSKSQLNRDPNTKPYKWIYCYDGKIFRGERKLLDYLNNQGFKIGATRLNSILKGHESSKHYKELCNKITRERNKEFNYNK